MTHDRDQEPFSVLDELQPFIWSSRESVAYEAAIEAINAAVGAYSARIAAEEAERDPDTAALAAWRQDRAACTTVRRQLDPADHAQIAEARRHYAALAQQIGQSGGLGGILGCVRGDKQHYLPAALIGGFGRAAVATPLREAEVLWRLRKWTRSRPTRAEAIGYVRGMYRIMRPPPGVSVDRVDELWDHLEIETAAMPGRKAASVQGATLRPCGVRR